MRNGMRALVGVMMGTLVFTAAGCGGDTPESLAQEQTTAMKQFVDILKSVKDKDTATAAKAKLTSMADSLKSLKKRVDALTDEQKKEVHKKLEEQLQPIMGEFMGEMFRVASLGPEVQKELESVQTAFEGLQ